MIAVFVEGLQTVAGGAVSFRPSTHTQVKYHQPHRSGGGANLLYGALDRTPGEDIGRPSDGELKTSDGRTKGDQTLLEGDGRLHRNRRRGGILEERREDTGKMTWRARNRGESWRGERGGNITITDGKHSNLNIETESRVQIADALGKELHHPKLSKLWDSEAGPTDRQTSFFPLLLLNVTLLHPSNPPPPTNNPPPCCNPLNPNNKSILPDRPQHTPTGPFRDYNDPNVVIVRQFF